MVSAGVSAAPPVTARRTAGYHSPFGDLTVQTDLTGAVTRVSFGDAPAGAEPMDAALSEAFDGYFATGYWHEPPLYCLKAGPFQTKVLELATSIPAGKTMTYGQVASAVGAPGASRAVGRALATNPLPFILACHRVVGAAGPGGYAGGLAFKRFLLGLEAGALTPSEL